MLLVGVCCVGVVVVYCLVLMSAVSWLLFVVCGVLCVLGCCCLGDWCLLCIVCCVG